MAADTTRVDRLRRARLTGKVPRDLVPWLLELAGAANTDRDVRSTPAERLADQFGDEIDRWMSQRGASQRSLSMSRRTLARALRGENVTLATVSAIADALGLEARITFHGGGAISGTKTTTDVPIPAPSRTMEAEGSSDEGIADAAI